MNVTAYLPDKIGERAKREKLKLSQMLREVVATELDRRDAMAQTLNAPNVYELDVADDEGDLYTGRITGMQIAEEENKTHSRVFLTSDQRVLVYDVEGREIWRDVKPEELRGWLGSEQYRIALKALGLKAVIDL